MGGEMTNLKNANLKVPPLKIVLSSATSGGSDRSTSTSPSSESESLDSNLTIISTSGNQQERNNSRSDQKDDPVQAKLDKDSKNTAKGNGAGSVNGDGLGGGDGVSCSVNESKVSNSASNATIASGSKRLHQDQSFDSNLESAATTREPALSSNQRITRSSQRAAQQNKSDNCNETNGDDTNLAENQDKSTSETGQRKVKRRKAEQTELPGETNQQVQPQPIIMADICPADYQLPSQNGFELYRDIRNRPHMKMMKLNLIPPRVPHGFRDYIIYGGPYLLEGNKVGLGLSGGRIGSPIKTNYGSTTCMTAKMKLSSNLQRRFSNFNQRHSAYIIPKPLEAPKDLKSGSPLQELFQDQERARQRMRVQHLKERERSVLTCEQEILRAYNQVTIADNQQKLHLSACTYFYYQERYHYVDEKNNYLDGKIDTHADELHATSDFEETNRAAFLKDLQDIDNKWAKIKNEMFVRHKNESDSLYAVQCLEWEWKAKEVGACDIRLSLKIDPEFVTRVVVSAHDY